MSEADGIIVAKRDRNPHGLKYVKFWIDSTAITYLADPEILLQLDVWRGDRDIPTRSAAVRKIIEYSIRQPWPGGTPSRVNTKLPLIRQFDQYCHQRMIFSRPKGLNSMIVFVVSQPWPIGNAMPPDKPK